MTASLPSFAELLPRVRALALAAGAEIMRIYAQDDLGVRAKADQSPVTAADLAADRVIAAGLAALDPTVPVVSEEGVEGQALAPGGRFWLVDPLDGTREFVKRNGEFTVNIALIDNHRPVLGVVLAPALDLWYEGAEGVGAFAGRGAEPPRPIRARAVPPEGMDVVSSRSHRDQAETEAYLARFKVRSDRPVGSSLKICLVAAGEADLYPRLGPTSEWDIAAGHAVLAVAGGHLRTLDGCEMAYGKAGLKNPFFIVTGLD